MKLCTAISTISRAFILVLENEFSLETRHMLHRNSNFAFFYSALYSLRKHFNVLADPIIAVTMTELFIYLVEQIDSFTSSFDVSHCVKRF